MSSSTKYISLLVLVILAISLSACQPAGSQIPQGTQVTPEIAATDEPIEQVLTPENTEAEVAAETPTASPTPDTLPTDIIDAKGVTMRLVPAGAFTMGEYEFHQISLPDYYMDKYEVTNTLYKACVEAGHCGLPRNTSRYDDEKYTNHPVVYVNWGQAQTYCEWRGARLPTEAEWEKAARGTDARTYPWGKGIDCQKANFSGCVNGIDLVGVPCHKSTHFGCVGGTKPVGSYPQGVSPYGLHDMAGNVWELVADWYDHTYYETLPENAFDPQGPESGEFRATRGGAFDASDGLTGSGSRMWGPPDQFFFNVGFRCALSSQIAATP